MEQSYFWVQVDTCRLCGRETLVLHCDNSGSEYDAVRICKKCVNKLFKQSTKD